MRVPRSEHARYAFGFSDKKPGLSWWIINLAITVYVVANFVRISH